MLKTPKTNLLPNLDDLCTLFEKTFDIICQVVLRPGHRMMLCNTVRLHHEVSDVLWSFYTLED